MADESVAQIISSLEKPLRFASKDGFAHINVLKDMEPLARRLAADLAGAGPRYARLARSITEIFKGFDSLPSELKARSVEAALAVLAGFTTGAPTEAIPTIATESASRPGLSTAAPSPPPPQPQTAAKIAADLATLSSTIEGVKGIGAKLAEVFEKKGISTIEDMLFFLPIRYEDRRALLKVRDLSPGTTATVKAEVLAIGETRYGRRRVFEMAIGDGTGILKLKWFNYRLKYMGRYRQGQWLSIYGSVTAFGGVREIIHPDIEILEEGEDHAGEAAPEGLVPVYSQVGAMHQKTLRRIVGAAVERYATSFVSGVPASVAARRALMPSADALRVLHMPGSDGEAAVDGAKRSLAFEELFMLEVGLALRRAQSKGLPGITIGSPDAPGLLESRLREALPFKLTAAQERVLAEIKADMASPHPMNRLLQGDVGSGKTIVSLIAALRAIECGFQAAIMAPTEILAEQHFLSIHEYAEELGITPLLLTGGMKKAARTAALAGIATGGAHLVVGTHALIQKDVEFRRLGLVIIDEQHRFGVAQRGVLKAKASGDRVDEAAPMPDMLIMTATPIPRTLSMTVFGDLDVSVIDELPPGRTPIATRIMRERDRERAYSVIGRELAFGGQAYIVYPLVEESEEMSLKDATQMSAHLGADIFPDYRVGLLHGRMKAVEKERVMRAFKDHSIDILVSTTVIEVGVDVPNATVIMIEHAERFGLAQMHQLRGRVGRGEKPSTCLLLAAWTNSEDTYRRLKVMEETTDGFRIAEEDLKIRGPGDFIGTRQAGLPGLRLSFALSDMKMLAEARGCAFEFIRKDPSLASADARVMREVIRRRWAGRLELADIG